MYVNGDGFTIKLNYTAVYMIYRELRIAAALTVTLTYVGN